MNTGQQLHAFQHQYLHQVVENVSENVSSTISSINLMSSDNES
jgi:hypothetical protein